MRPDRFRAVGRAQRAVPSARRRAPDDRHAEDGGCDLLHALLPGARRRRGGARARPAIHDSPHPVLWIGRVPTPNRTGGCRECRHGAARRRISERRRAPATLPWLTEADIDFYAGEFARTGFRGGLNWYRNIDRNWELLSPWAGANVSVPALYLAGERDLVLGFGGTDKVLASLKQIVPNLRQARILPGCGHWTQRERPAEVNAAVLEFLRTL